MYGGKFALASLQWEGNYHFCFVLLCIRGQIPSTSPRGACIRKGDLTEGFFALRFWGAHIWRGLFSEFYGIFIVRKNSKSQSSSYLYFNFFQAVCIHVRMKFKSPNLQEDTPKTEPKGDYNLTLNYRSLWRILRTIMLCYVTYFK